MDIGYEGPSVNYYRLLLVILNIFNSEKLQIFPSDRQNLIIYVNSKVGCKNTDRDDT